MNLRTLLLFALTSVTAAAAPTATQDAVYKALSARDPAPTCAQVEALSDDPVGDLLFVVDHATQPPWAGMRAAACLVDGHAEEVQPRISAWVEGKDTRGFAIMVFERLDTMPLSVATEVATKGLRGPWADDARPHILRSSVPEIRRLAE